MVGVSDYNRYRLNECGKNLSEMGSVSVSLFYRVIKILTKDYRFSVVIFLSRVANGK